jgi:hypothetical protein
MSKPKYTKQVKCCYSCNNYNEFMGDSYCLKYKINVKQHFICNNYCKDRVKLEIGKSIIGKSYKQRHITSSII